MYFTAFWPPPSGKSPSAVQTTGPIKTRVFYSILCTGPIEVRVFYSILATSQWQVTLCRPDHRPFTGLIYAHSMHFYVTSVALAADCMHFYLTCVVLAADYMHFYLTFVVLAADCTHFYLTSVALLAGFLDAQIS